MDKRSKSRVPPINECRHAVLEIRTRDQNDQQVSGYVIYDRREHKIVNGVYYGDIEDALDVARYYNEDPGAPKDMAPNAVALGLVFPRQ